MDETTVSIELNRKQIAIIASALEDAKSRIKRARDKEPYQSEIYELRNRQVVETGSLIDFISTKELLK